MVHCQQALRAAACTYLDHFRSLVQHLPVPISILQKKRHWTGNNRSELWTSPPWSWLLVVGGIFDHFISPSDPAVVCLIICTMGSRQSSVGAPKLRDLALVLPGFVLVWVSLTGWQRSGVVYRPDLSKVIYYRRDRLWQINEYFAAKRTYTEPITQWQHHRQHQTHKNKNTIVVVVYLLACSLLSSDSCAIVSGFII